jgi:hypothetical protein
MTRVIRTLGVLICCIAKYTLPMSKCSAGLTWKKKDHVVVIKLISHLPLGKEGIGDHDVANQAWFGSDNE